MDLETQLRLLLDRSAAAERNLQTLLTWSTRAEGRLHDLVDRADQVDEQLDYIRAEVAGKKDFTEVKEEIRVGTRAMRHHTAYVQNLLDVAANKHLSAEDQLDGMRLQLEQMQHRIEDLEKRNPAA